ncbi:MAG TPA: ATP synthase subunit I [Deltaproteobacteria bacterium]|mgnify:CR=1 FL=1|nr:ATP synthase subunit I [Deltaproteobacteria bacterium]HPJ93658.1 ATP synthase subunit I [Deltaproteobacteria bacterium]HPR50604.1 ATP synthase subunit I [Deltaproteobacteria bacterium]
MGETLYLILSFSAGMALGAFYFLSLWKTLQKITDIPSPGFVMLKSYLIRTSVVLAGFYLVMDGHWQRAVAALVGFVVMRMILTRRLGKERLVS